jgi:hypothetical protein
MSGQDNEGKSNRKSTVLDRRNMLLAGTTIAAATAIATTNPLGVALAQQQLAASPASTKKPNILVIFGDDIGQSNISAYTFGLMGYRTPNIDRIGTLHRAAIAFILQSAHGPVRTRADHIQRVLCVDAS